MKRTKLMNTMSVFLLLFLRIFMKFTLAVEFEYNVVSMEADWTTAQAICELSQKLLAPDLGLDGIEKLGMLGSFKTEELIWINAKNIEIVYDGAVSAYLKFAYQPADSKLTSYLCHNAQNGERRRNISSSPMSWKEAQKVCSSSGKWTLYNISTPRQAKGTVALLKKDVTFWVDKMSDHKIPNMVSDGLHMKEQCIGVMKLSDGTLAYRRDNCTNRHKYVCFSSVEAFAPTVTKMTEPFSFASQGPEQETGNSSASDIQNNKSTSDHNGEESSDETGMSGGMIGGIVSGAVGGVLIILAAVGIIYCLRRRWRSKRDYLRSLHRYTQRHASSRKLLENSMSRSLPGSSCQISKESIQQRCQPDEYEESEKRQYAQCQKDVIQGLKTRYAKYPSPAAGAALDKLPAYHSMDGKSRLHVLPAYESYDPDPGHLAKVHGYINKEIQPQLSDLDQYDNIPKLPEKKGKSTALGDLEQYENHSTGNMGIVGKNEERKHLGDPDGKNVSSLDELDQYENYEVPKRQKGLFKMFKTDKANKAKKALKDERKDAEPITLNDLAEYEELETTRKEVKQLNDLDAYENYTIKKF